MTRLIIHKLPEISIKLKLSSGQPCLTRLVSRMVYRSQDINIFRNGWLRGLGQVHAMGKIKY